MILYLISYAAITMNSETYIIQYTEFAEIDSPRNNEAINMSINHAAKAKNCFTADAIYG